MINLLNILSPCFYLLGGTPKQHEAENSVPTIEVEEDDSHVIWVQPPTGSQGVRERARVFETLIFFSKGLMLQYCARFPATGNTIACSCSMSATGAPNKALKVRPLAAKHYLLRHSCPLPNSLLGLFLYAWEMYGNSIDKSKLILQRPGCSILGHFVNINWISMVN